MNTQELRDRIDIREFSFSTSRSSGPGGQNVNKVNTRVELRFNIPASNSLTGNEKELALDILRNRINNEGNLLIISQSERTQLANRKKAEESFFKILAKTLTLKPERKATRPTAASKTKRLEVKHKRSTVKNLRRDGGFFEE